MDVDWSRPIWEKTGMNEILGLPMSQNGFVVPWLTEMAKIAPPGRIIEIGTGTGGLAMLLDVIPRFHFAVTYDVVDRLCPQACGLDFRRKDVFDAEDEIISELQQDHGMQSWLLCDGGDKNREVETFAPFLKPGDIIAAHDYAPTREWWNWHEIDEQRIEKVARKQNLVTIPELQYDRKAAWWVRRKAS